MKAKYHAKPLVVPHVFVGVVAIALSTGLQVMGFSSIESGFRAPNSFLKIVHEQGDETSLNWTFPASKVSRLIIKNASGDIVLRKSESDEVRITATKYDGSQEDLDKVKVDLQQKDEELVIDVEYWAKISPVSVKFSIEAPFGLSIELDSGSGNVTVEGYSGTVKVDTGSGNIVLRDVDGEVHADTGSGDIEVTYTRPLSQTNNPVLLSEVLDKWSYSIIRDETKDLTINKLSQPKLSGSGQQIFSSGSGNITLNLASHLKVDVFAETLSQKFRSDFNEMQDVRDGVRYVGHINGGGPLVILTTGSGGISVKRLTKQ